MLPTREISIQLPHIKLAGLEYGDPEGEPVLALHGWLDNAMSFARLNPKLKGMRIIALDLMGHGFSEHKPVGVGYQLWDAAFSVVAAVHQLGWQRCTLLGHSLGAIISVMVASIRPDMVKQLMLIDGLIALYKQPSEFPEQLQQAMLGFAKLMQEPNKTIVYSSLDEMIKKRQNGFIPLSYEASSLLMERGAKAVEGGYSWRSDRQLMVPSPLPLTEDAAWSYAEQVSCPIYLALAKQGLLVGHKAFMQRLSNLTRCQTQLFEGSHHLHLESEQAAENIATYFNSVLVNK